MPEQEYRYFMDTLSPDESDRLARMERTFYGDAPPADHRGYDALAGDLDVLLTDDGETVIVPRGGGEAA